MEKERGLEYRFVLSPADFSGIYSREQSASRFAALRSLSCCLLVGIPLVLATNVIDSSSALAGVVGVVGMMTIVAGVMSNLSPILARPAKVEQFEPVPTLIRINADGISKYFADTETRIGWNSVTQISLSEFGVGLVARDSGWFIPVSAFGSRDTMRVEYDRIVSFMNSVNAAQKTEHSVPYTLH